MKYIAKVFRPNTTGGLPVAGKPGTRVEMEDILRRADYRQMPEYNPNPNYWFKGSRLDHYAVIEEVPDDSTLAS